jgi:cytochrome P450
VPERWLPAGQRPAEYDKDHLSASKPFSVGFHSCLGRPLAWVELRLVITRLLWAFDFAEEPTERVNFDDFPVIMLIQKEAMRLRVKTRIRVAYKEAPQGESLERQWQ